MKEWVAFHYLVGFRTFYIYVHNCSDDSQRVVQSLQKHFDIKAFSLGADVNQPQYVSYMHAYENFGREIDWMAFIDGDEFLFPTSSTGLRQVLEDFSHKNLSALAVYWACFGSSGHIKEPDGLIIENYRYRGELAMPVNRHVKSLVLGKQKFFQIAADPHVFNTPLGTFDEKLRPIIGGWTPYDPSYDFLRINHYACQSREFYETFKRDKGTAIDNAGTVTTRNESWWQELDRNEVYDQSVEHLIDPLKDLLKRVTD